MKLLDRIGGTLMVPHRAKRQSDCFDDWTDNSETGETKAFFEFYQRTKHKFVFKPICRISLGGMHMTVYHV